MLPQVNDRLDGNTLAIPATKSIRDCAKIVMTTDSNLLASGSNIILNSAVGATWAVSYDPLGGSWDSNNPSRLIFPRGGLKIIEFNVRFLQASVANSGYYLFLRINGTTDLGYNSAWGFDNQGLGTISEAATLCRPRNVTANSYVELGVNLTSTTLTRKILAKTSISYYSIVGDP